MSNKNIREILLERLKMYIRLQDSCMSSSQYIMYSNYIDLISDLLEELGR